MSYPVYIPLYFGPTGPPRPTDAVALMAVLGMAGAAIHYIYKPKFQLKVTHESINSANVHIRTKHYPTITQISNENMACLKKKGYRIYETLDKNIYSNWRAIARLEMQDKDPVLPDSVVAEKVIADCKECNAHTEILYRYDNEFGNEVQQKKKLYWHKCYMNELK
jgi:hypothetical protein